MTKNNANVNKGHRRARAGKPLTDQDVEFAAVLLGKLSPGLLPVPIFQQVSRLVTIPMIEIVALSEQADGSTHVLLLERPADDPARPGQLYIPNTIIRASDKPDTFEDPLRRIINKDLTDLPINEPQLARTTLRHSGRGMELVLVFVVSIPPQFTERPTYNVAQLPANIARVSVESIMAAMDFLKTQ